MMYEVGENYTLVPFTEAHMGPKYLRWLHDPLVSRYNSHGLFPLSEADLKDFARSLGSREKIVWAIEHGEDGLVGNVALQGISWINRRAELAILIGEPSHWGSGLGLATCRQVVMHGFQALNLDKIHLSTVSSNIGMRSVATRLGFIEEGILRQHSFLLGSWEDVVVYGLLRDEFPSI